MKLLNKQDLDKLVEEPFEKFLSRLDLKCPESVEAIPVEWLLSILSNTYNETIEDSYSLGFEDGWNACLKTIKEELDYWEKENANV